MKSIQTSQRINRLPEAMSVYFNQIVYDLRRLQRDVITLSLGEAFFAIPPYSFERLDFERGYHYSDSQGIPPLRDKIANLYNHYYGASISPDDVLVSAGSKILIFMCMQVLLDPGSSVLIHEPAWLSYKEQAQLCDANVHYIPYDEPVSNFGTYFTQTTRLLIINNPNNPSGRLYTRDELTAIHDDCKKHNIFLLVDEAYSDYILDQSFYSAACLSDTFDNLIVVNSLSKNLGMSGWRLGYVISSAPIIFSLLKLNQHLITCAPTILQLYVSAYLDKILEETIPQIKELILKRKKVAFMLDSLDFEYLPSSSTFYFFVRISPEKLSVFDFCLYLLVFHGISVVPGIAYGESTREFIRISIGAESDERIYEALLCIKTYLGKAVSTSELYTELQRLNISSFHD